MQRILKYPLLVKDLLYKGTPADHVDHGQLTEALLTLTSVAESINTSKRYKDVVVKSHERHGATDKAAKLLSGQVSSKAYARVTQKLGQVVGVGSQTVDEKFNMQLRRLERGAACLPAMARVLGELLSSMEASYAHQGTMMHAWEEFHTFSHTGNIAGVINMKQVVNAIVAVEMPTLRSQLDASVFAWLQGAQRGVDSAQELVSKRNRKLLDYDRHNDLKSKGEKVSLLCGSRKAFCSRHVFVFVCFFKPDKLIQEGAASYIALNTKLLEELPTLNSIVQVVIEVRHWLSFSPKHGADAPW